MVSEPPAEATPERWKKRDFAQNPLYKALGLRVDEARQGYARISLETNRLTGGQGEGAEAGGIGGSVHGGILALMLDVVVVEVIFASLGHDDRPAGTADLSITYMRPALGERVFAEGTLLRKGRQLAVVEVSITDSQGRMCAKGRALYALRA